MIRKLAAYFVILIFPICCSAGNNIFQVGAIVSPSMEGFSGKGREFKPSYNFGLDYKLYLSPNLTFQTGVQYQNKGFRVIIPLSSDLAATEVFSAHYISVPTILNGHIKTGTRSRILISGGITNGYLVSQTRRIKKSDIEDAESFKDEEGKPYTDKTTPITYDFFNKRYTGLQVGVGYMKFIKKKVVLEIHPSYAIQLNNALSRKANLINSDGKKDRFKSLSVDIKLGYYINKQIDQKNKAF